VVLRVWGSHRLRYGVVGVVVVALVVAGVVAVRGREPTGVPHVAGQAKSPAQVGAGYMTALAQGSAHDALAYVATKPESTVFLTDEVLAESAKLNPITDIAVLDSSQRYDHGTVTVRYRLAGTRVIDTYPVERFDNGFWFISTYGSLLDAVGFVEVGVDGLSTAGITLNDVEVEPGTNQIQLFPGTYRLGSTNPMVTTSSVLVVPGLSSDFAVPLRLDPQLRLTPQAHETVVSALSTTLDRCLQETSLTTSCGLSVSSIYREGVADGATALWALTPGSFDIAKTAPRVLWGEYRTAYCQDPEDGLWAYWSDTSFEAITARATMMRNGAVGDYTDRLHTYGVEISDPDHPKVYLQWLDASVCRTSEAS